VASLFGKNKLRGRAHLVPTAQILPYLAIVQTWRDDYHTGTLKKDKETSREQAYNQDFFLRILGYREKPASPYSFEPKATTTRGQLPDAVLSHSDPKENIQNIAAVVELKGASIALDRPQQREGNMSPVQQAFKYKTLYRSCPFVIVSNFYELRLYNDNQLDYEKWTLDDLLDPADDYIQFKLFYVLLHADNLTIPRGKSKTVELLTDIRVQQEKIGKAFFEEYRQARLELFRDIYRSNPSIRATFELAMEKGQKVVDRIVFACFAEDSGLLPENIITRVVMQADQSAFGASLWSVFKAFFASIDIGSARLDIPQGYNGGLFAEDVILNNLSISDEPLRQIALLARYNFTDDLTVNILGHIFEQSISDLEDVKAKIQQVNASQALATVAVESKRKTGGIYYTPEYIVRYIIDNTVGAYLREQEDRLKDKFRLKGDILDKSYARRENQVYVEYQSILQNIRVLDPACGSGAFLVYAFDFLLSENMRVEAILGGSLFSTDMYVRDILRSNLFGVDLNEESVEITKLSLWLKTAQPGKKLTALDKNIRCGNSLIDHPKAAGKKAFNWQQEFADVFSHDGFDVVVGNPPYVSAMEIRRSFTKPEFDHLKKEYRTAVGTIDLYIYFFERALTLLKPGGKMAYISPNRYLSAKYGKALREWIVSDFKIASLIDYSDKKVFADASTYPVITFLNKEHSSGPYVLSAGKIDEESKNPVLIDFDSSNLSIMDDTILGFLLNDKMEITKRIFAQSVSLSKVGMINATSTAKEADEYAPLINDSSGLKLINTGTIDPYANFWGLRKLTKQGNQYLKPYLSPISPAISQNRIDLYQSPKIIISKIGLTCEAFYDEKGEFASIDTNCIHSFSSEYRPEYVLCWLNSKLYNYSFECLFDGLRMAGGYLLYSSPNLKNTPIMCLSLATQEPFVTASTKMQSLHTKLNEADDSFKRLLLVGLGAPKLPARLGDWWEMDFGAFAKALKLKLTLQKADELLQLFDKYASTLKATQDEIKTINREIDEAFYKLFKLTPAEVSTVNNAFN